MSDKTNGLDAVAYGLLVIGGINWGLVGFFGFDLVAAIFGDMSVLSRIVYSLVGLSSLYMLARVGMFFGRQTEDYTTTHATGGRTM